MAYQPDVNTGEIGGVLTDELGDAFEEFLDCPCWKITVRSSFDNNILREALTGGRCDKVLIWAHGSRSKDDTGILTYPKNARDGRGGPKLSFNDIRADDKSPAPHCTFYTCYGENIADEANRAGIPSVGATGSRDKEILLTNLGDQFLKEIRRLAREDDCENQKSLCILIGTAEIQFD